MSAYTHQSLASSIHFIDSHCPTHHLSKPRLSLLHSKPIKTCIALSATTPPTSSTTQSSRQIFLPFLQQLEQKPEPKPLIHEEEEEEEAIDPFVKFFKSKTPSQDPPGLGKFSLQKNRRSSWHLSTNQPETLTESDINDVTFDNEVKQQMGSLPDGTVGEILRIARNLPENSTLGEMLGGFKGRVSKRECVEVLELMGNEYLLMCCLYFYEWLRLQEPSLVSPCACSVLFPVLGRARIGDELMVLFKNLPLSKEFTDTHVYNAAISGLFWCGRYDDAWKAYEAMETNNIIPDNVT